MRYRLDRLGALCQCAEDTLARDVAQGREALVEVVGELDALHPGGGPALGRLRSLRALEAALSRAGTPESAEVIAHKAVQTMWQEYFSLARAVRSDQRARGKQLWPWSKSGLVRSALVFVVIAAVWSATLWVKRDAASDINYDLLSGDSPGVALLGFHGVEHDRGRVWRWMDGPNACLGLTMPKEREVVFTFSAMNPIPGQRLDVVLNNVKVASYDNLAVGTWDKAGIRGELKLRLRVGGNTLCFEFADYNHHLTAFAPGDPSPYALAITGLTLVAVP
jgi:hypothetical protein